MVPKRATLDRAMDVLNASADRDWLASGTLMHVVNGISDMDVDAGRVLQFVRGAAQSGDGKAILLWTRSRRMHDLSDQLQQLFLQFMLLYC